MQCTAHWYWTVFVLQIYTYMVKFNTTHNVWWLLSSNSRLTKDIYPWRMMAIQLIYRFNCRTLWLRNHIDAACLCSQSTDLLEIHQFKVEFPHTHTHSLSCHGVSTIVRHNSSCRIAEPVVETWRGSIKPKMLMNEEIMQTSEIKETHRLDGRLMLRSWTLSTNPTISQMCFFHRYVFVIHTTHILD